MNKSQVHKIACYFFNTGYNQPETIGILQLAKDTGLKYSLSEEIENQ